MSAARSRHCKAIPFWQSLLVFGAPGLLIWAGVHWLVPAWVGAGVPLVFAWSFCVLVPTIGNTVVVLTIYAVRERPDWRTFQQLVWRGYLLPGQETRHGRWAWLVNGTLWNVPFHLYTLFNCLSELPFYLVLPFVVQRIGNTWVAVGVHALMASMAYILILPGVLRG